MNGFFRVNLTILIAFSSFSASQAKDAKDTKNPKQKTLPPLVALAEQLEVVGSIKASERSGEPIGIVIFKRSGQGDKTILAPVGRATTIDGVMFVVKEINTTKVVISDGKSHVVINYHEGRYTAGTESSLTAEELAGWEPTSYSEPLNTPMAEETYQEPAEELSVEAEVAVTAVRPMSQMRGGKSADAVAVSPVNPSESYEEAAEDLDVAEAE